MRVSTIERMPTVLRFTFIQYVESKPNIGTNSVRCPVKVWNALHADPSTDRLSESQSLSTVGEREMGRQLRPQSQLSRPLSERAKLIVWKTCALRSLRCAASMMRSMHSLSFIVQRTCPARPFPDLGTRLSIALLRCRSIVICS